MKDSTPVQALSVAPNTKNSNYPEPFASQVGIRTKRRLGDAFGLENFGVNITELAPGAMSALKHAHATQDEFVYLLEGMLTLVTGDAEYEMLPGDCVGFRAGIGTPHHLVNKSGVAARFLEIGDRSVGDVVTYPDDDLQARYLDGVGWKFFRRDGSAY